MIPLLSEKRKYLGLSTTEVAHRLGISQSSVVRLEQSEAAESITLNSLKRVAEALDCELTYTLTPRSATTQRKAYPGLQRSNRGRSASKKNKSSIGNALRKDVEKRSQLLSAAEKVTQACSLSDLAKELKACSKTR